MAIFPCSWLCFKFYIRVSKLIWFLSFCFRSWWRSFKILSYRGILWLSDSPDFLSRACKKGIKTGKDYCKYIWPDSKHQNTPSWNPKTGLKKFRIIFFSPKIDIFISKMNFHFFNFQKMLRIFGRCSLNGDPRTKTGRSRTDLFLIEFLGYTWTDGSSEMSVRWSLVVKFLNFYILNLKRNFYHLFDDWNGQRKMEIMVSWMLWQKKTHQNVLLSGTNHRPLIPVCP